jgi:hypothetical protein
MLSPPALQKEKAGIDLSHRSEAHRTRQGPVAPVAGSGTMMKRLLPPPRDKCQAGNAKHDPVQRELVHLFMGKAGQQEMPFAIEAWSR